jgi:hypothetical protein
LIEPSCGNDIDDLPKRRRLVSEVLRPNLLFRIDEPQQIDLERARVCLRRLSESVNRDHDALRRALVTND